MYYLHKCQCHATPLALVPCYMAAHMSSDNYNMYNKKVLTHAYINYCACLDLLVAIVSLLILLGWSEFESKKRALGM